MYILCSSIPWVGWEGGSDGSGRGLNMMSHAFVHLISEIVKSKGRM